MTDHTLPPNDTAVEEALIGAVVTAGRDAFHDVQHIEARDFLIVANGIVWDVIRAVYERGDALDLVTVEAELRRQKTAVEVPGVSRNLAGMVIRSLDVNDPRDYAAIIAGCSFQRKALKMASDIAEKAYSGLHPKELMSRIGALASRLNDVLPGEDSYHRGAGAHDAHQALVKLRLSSEAPDTHTIPYPGFSEIVPLIRAGKFVLVSGLSGHGKTIILEQWAEWSAMLGHRVLYMTTELTNADHLDRRYVRHTGLSYAQVVAPSDVTSARLDAIKERIKWQRNIDVLEVNEFGHEALIAQMQRAYEHGTRTFYIDYFWEILADTDKATVNAAVRALHRFAKTRDALVVVASQMSETEFGLRTYGTRRLEQKCAVHLVIGRSEPLTMHQSYVVDGKVLEFDSDQPNPMKTISVVKNTFGPSHQDVQLFLHGERVRFLGANEVGHGVPKSLQPSATAEQLFSRVEHKGEARDDRG